VGNTFRLLFCKEIQYNLAWDAFEGILAAMESCITVMFELWPVLVLFLPSNALHLCHRQLAMQIYMEQWLSL
jgi:hypothetical protein